LRAAGLNGTAPRNAVVIKKLIDDCTDNWIWLISTGAGLVLVILAGLLMAEPASAAPHPSVVPLAIGDPTGITDAIGDGIKAITGVFVGGFQWTTDVAGKFIINTLGGLVDLLIPDSGPTRGSASCTGS
ncbi:MAG: hypothetical protein LC790_11595, partial [Actinobacteria bacterium]|nr:hypothetical protein [Actinomycetota bacterium]